MKKQVFLALIFCILFAKNVCSAIVPVDRLPSETIVFKPQNPGQWKEISRSVTEQRGLVEYIHINQKVENWSELIAIQYLEKAIIDKAKSLEGMIALMRKTTIEAYPGNQVTWNVLEQGKSDIIYEWILHKPYKNIPPQHEIARAILTDTGFHRIGFTKQYKEMSKEEKETRLKLLREDIRIADFEAATKMKQCLSLADKYRDALDLGPSFTTWKTVNSFAFDNGYTLVARIPPSQKEDAYIAECLEVISMPNPNDSSIDKLFEIERRSIQDKSPKKVKFQILKKSPNEVIYCYSHPKDHLLCNGVVRSFVADQGYYSISYKHGLIEEMKMEEVARWKDLLEDIKIRS